MIDKECIICGNMFKAKQWNYLTCCKICKDIYKKEYFQKRQKGNEKRLDYINEKNKERYHRNKKRFTS